jgi:maltose/maltodextrin transport system permease protein
MDSSRAMVWALHAVAALAVLGLLALAQQMLRLQEPLWAMGLLGLAGIVVLVQLSRRLQSWRYVLPGALAVLVFVVLPMVFTVVISFTNYSSRNLLSFERATAVLLERSDSQGMGMDFALHREGASLYVQLRADKGQAQDASQAWHAGPFDADATRVDLRSGPGEPPGAALNMRELVELLPWLSNLDLITPDGQRWRLSGLSRVADHALRYRRLSEHRIEDLRDGSAVVADVEAGFWRDAQGVALEPGFRTTVGVANYARLFGDERFLEPFARVFAWTVTFASLNTLFTFGLGLFFAVALSWPALKGRHLYRVALFLPYAVPAFISIPIFRGLFNENLGEVNLVLDLLFDIRPGWFSDATLARGMVLLVNTWLGYPYMMILAMGLLKAIPEDLYEASALAGAGPVDNLLRITLPLVARPMAPLLVASFAANFNNLTLIALLTEGGPDRLDTDVPVGATDLLVSYTYRMAFNDGGQNYALACAISAVVFLLVAALAALNLRLFGPRR